MTGRDLISAALRLIGVKASGESLTADEAKDGLSTLNSMIDGMSNESLLIFEQKEEAAITLVAGTASYTLGSGGSITTRPQRITNALIRDSDIDYPVRILTQDEYARIPDKATQSPLPFALYEDGGYPQRTVKLYPVPSAANQLRLFTLRPLTQVATLDTVLSLPPGYERMLKYNLALELAPEYGKSAPAEVVKIAAEAKATVKRGNHKPLLMRCDPVPASGNRGSYDIFSGGYRT